MSLDLRIQNARARLGQEVAVQRSMSSDDSDELLNDLEVLLAHVESQTSALRALEATWRENAGYLDDHAVNEPAAAEQAHVYRRCADDLAVLLRHEGESSRE